MNKCPHCNMQAVGAVRKSFLGQGKSVNCKHCGESVVVSAKSVIFTLAFVTLVFPVVSVAEHMGLARHIVYSLLLGWGLLYVILYTVCAPLVKARPDTGRQFQKLQLAVLIVIGSTGLSYALWALVVRPLITNS